MDRGNLSNEIAPKVGVRFENVIYNFGQPNQPGIGEVERLMSKNINLYFISLLPEKKVRAWCYKWSVMYTGVLEAESVLEITELVIAHKMMLYIDTDDRILAEVSMRSNPQCETQKWVQQIEFGTGINH